MIAGHVAAAEVADLERRLRLVYFANRPLPARESRRLPPDIKGLRWLMRCFA
jgi:hypothetical protein